MPLPLRGAPSSLPPTHHLAGVQAVVAIAAGKGGVGKSSVCVNLALALQLQGFCVGILDADIYGPSVRKMLPEERPPREEEATIQPALCRGIKMISMAYFRKEAAAVRAPIANSLVSRFIKQTNWGALDFLLVDFPPGTGDVQLTLCQQAPLLGALMVTTPQDVSLLDVRKAAALFDWVKVPILGVVENMSYYQSATEAEPLYLFGRGGGERLAKEIDVPLWGEIPIDPLLCSCGDAGHSLFAHDPGMERPVTRAFQKLARQLALQTDSLKGEQEKRGGFFECTWNPSSGFFVR